MPNRPLLRNRGRIDFIRQSAHVRQPVHKAEQTQAPAFREFPLCRTCARDSLHVLDRCKPRTWQSPHAHACVGPLNLACRCGFNARVYLGCARAQTRAGGSSGDLTALRRLRRLPGFEVYRFGKGNRNVTSAAALRLFSGNFRLTSCCSRMVSQDGFRGDGPSCPQVPPVDGYVTKQQ